MLTVDNIHARNHVARRRKLWVEASQDSNQLYPRETISVLPEDVLLEIFVYVVRPQETSLWSPNELQSYEGRWYPLVHVCKRWRCIVFASPNRLDLRILCTNRRPVERLLYIWPSFPIYLYGMTGIGKTSHMPDLNNIIAALRQHHRVFGINIDRVPNSLLTSSVAMQSFPLLSELTLSSIADDEWVPVVPDSFLGGSAPRLRTLSLRSIPFPGLGKLLVSSTDLVRLSLLNIPHSGYISPEAMTASLSTLTRLEVLDLRFRSPRSRPVRENQKPSHLIRDVFRALESLDFRGDSEYLEYIVARMDAPLLRKLYISFFNQLVFDTPQLCRFISCIENVKLKAPDHASISFSNTIVNIDIFTLQLSLRILCSSSDWQLSSLAQLYDSALSPLPTLECLEICDYREYWEDDMENVQWLELLHPFSSVKELVLSDYSDTLFGRIALALDEFTGESVIEVLPALLSLSLKGQQPSEVVRTAIRNSRFIATRQLLGYPVTVQY